MAPQKDGTHESKKWCKQDIWQDGRRHVQLKGQLPLCSATAAVKKHAASLVKR